MKKGWITTFIILLMIIGILIGICIYNKNKTEDINIINNKKLAEREDTEISTIFTSSSEEKVSPNAIVLEKQYFIGCDHLIKDTKDIPEYLINKNKQAVEKYYKDWKIEKFSPNEIILYQENEGFCDQHYLIKEHNGVLGIYTINENGQITLKQDTEIQTMYLTEIDLEKVQQGIEAVGNMELNSVLGDFE